MNRDLQPRKNYYKLLGVDPKASIEEIKKAYRKRAKETHPDKAAQNGLTVKKAEELFKDIQEAYEVLGDSTKRGAYDFDNTSRHTSTESKFQGFSGFWSNFDFNFNFEYKEHSFSNESCEPDFRVNYKKLEKHVENFFASSTLEKLAKDNIEVADYDFDMAIIFRKGNNAFTKDEEKEILNIFQKLGFNPKTITFEKPCRLIGINSGPRICIDLPLLEFLQILKIDTSPNSEFAFKPFGNFNFEYEHKDRSSSFDFKFEHKERSFSRATLYPSKLSEELNRLIEEDNIEKFKKYLGANICNDDLLKTIFYNACIKGKINIAKYLIVVKNIDPNLLVFDGLSFTGAMFKAAAEGGNLELVKYLYENHHVDIESQGISPGTRCSALSRAARKGHLKVVQYLISKGANLNSEIAHTNILVEAIHSGKLDVVKCLFEAGVKKDEFALGHALEEGYLDITQYLLLKRPGIKSHQYTESPACLAIRSGNLALVSDLEEKHALNIFEPFSFSWGDTRQNLLLAAGDSGSIEMVKYLLETKGLINDCRSRKNKNQYIYALLTSAIGANGFASKKIPDSKRIKLVQFLIEEKHLELPIKDFVEFVVKEARFCGIKMNAYLQSYFAASADLRDLLLRIASHGLTGLSIVELFRLYNMNILNKGKYSNFEDEIHHHIQERKIPNDQLKLLAFQNKQFGKDALFYYSSYYCKKDLSQLQLLLNLGVDIDSENSEGETPLVYAFQSGGYNEIVKFLIDHGADVHKKCKRGGSIANILKKDQDFNIRLEKLAKKKVDSRKETFEEKFRKTSQPEGSFFVSGDQKDQFNKHNHSNIFAKENQTVHSTERCLIKAELPKRIAFSDKPLNLGGKIEYLTVEEFQKKLGITYDESIYIDSKTQLNKHTFREDLTGDVSSSSLKKQAEKILKTPNENMVICNMGELGYGVFASKSIEKDTVLAVFAGTLIPEDKTRNPIEYGLSYHGTNCCFSTLKKRGIASFFQHLPAKLKIPDITMLLSILKMTGQNVSEAQLKQNDELYSVEFKESKISKTVATENLRREYVIMDGVPVVLMVVNERIEAGSQIGFNYSYAYWESRNCLPELFHKDGSVIAHDHYKRTFGHLKFDGFTYTGEFKPLIDALNKGTSEVTIVDDNRKARSVSASQLTQLLVRVNAVPEPAAVVKDVESNKGVERSASSSSTGQIFQGMMNTRSQISSLVSSYGLKDASLPELERGLRKAAANNKENGVKKFLEAKVNVNAQDPKLGKTALHWAVEKNALGCVKILLSNGAKNSIIDASGKKPSDYPKIAPEILSLLNPSTSSLAMES